MPIYTPNHFLHCFTCLNLISKTNLLSVISVFFFFFFVNSMDGGSAKCNVVVSGNNDISVPFDHHFDLDDAMTMPENLLTRHQTVVGLVSDMPTVKQATGSCSICMESLSEFEGDGSRQVLCGHVYHHDCITDWLLNGNSNSCPICRHEICG
ncbi:uncharacterized protein LOC108462461 [Gossypium arboreum]|uniref:uncharacterized protein LOC108462461 n=1 Tax=Gossypium arboreum TaxID=29729 RepID=UPI0022F199DE|nr:uncharacterized protein LOC108462461 [Gossypium arboreum]